MNVTGKKSISVVKEKKCFKKAKVTVEPTGVARAANFSVFRTVNANVPNLDRLSISENLFNSDRLSILDNIHNLDRFINSRHFSNVTGKKSLSVAKEKKCFKKAKVTVEPSGVARTTDFSVFGTGNANVPDSDRLSISDNFFNLDR